MKGEPAYRRVLLKLSGEALMGGRNFGLDPETLERIATEVKSIHDIGIEVCLVVGGGNIFRASSRPPTPSIGRPATIWVCWRQS